MSENPIPEQLSAPAPTESAGALLRARREELGISVEEAAEAIKLRARQVLAMESDDFQSLGSTPHAKGFLRNYARFLRLDPAEALERMSRDAAPVAAELRGPDDTGVAMPAPGGRKPLAWALALSPLVLLALGAGILYALGVNFDRWRGTEPAASASVPASTPMPTPAASRPTPAARPVTSAALAVMAPTAPAQPLPPPPVAPQAQPAAAVPPAAPAPLAAAAPGAQPAAHRMVLNFLKESWVEVRDGSGRILLSQKVPGSNTRILEGKPPFSLVIGNAPVVQLQYDDRPVDLAPFTKVDVARLTLN